MEILNDEELDCLAALAASMPWAIRDAFVRLVANKLAGYPPQARGPGLAHRLGVEAQRAFVNLAVGHGGKHGRAGAGTNTRIGSGRW